MRIYMQTPYVENQPLKYYHLILQQDLLEGWMIIREWGYQGERGRSRRDHFSNREEAQRMILKWRDNQIGRGFRVVFVSGSGGHAE